MALVEAEERVGQLESAIQRLDSVRKHLNTNAADIKSEIRTCITRNLESLQGREAVLYDEVAKVLRMKEETLQRQQVRLNQALTVLNTGLALVLNDAASEKQLQDTLERLKQIETSPEETPYISFRADHIQLRESILSYGRVDGNGLPLMTAFDDPGNPSTSLPRQVEEYEDADHHVFYKTVADVKRSNVAASSINVSIPKLSNRVEDWLQKKLPTSLPMTPVEAPSPPVSHRPALRPSKLGTGFLEGPMSTSSTPGSSCSLNNWLSIIKQHADLEEEHDFEIVDNSSPSIKGELKPQSAASKSTQPVHRDYFQHIQKDLSLWLLPGSLDRTVEPMADFFSHIPSDTKLWVKQAYDQLSSLEDLQRGDFFAHISKDTSTWLRSRAHGKQPPQKAREQESVEKSKDVFAHISSSSDKWLLKQRAPSTSQVVSPNKIVVDKEKWLLKPATPMQIEDICRGNDLCQKWSQCVSKPNCASLYASSSFKPLELGQSEWLMKSSHTEDEAAITDGSMDAKGASFEPLQPAVSEWLAKSSQCKSEGKTHDVFAHFKSKADPCWLPREKPNVPSVVMPELPGMLAKGDSNQWLKKTRTPAATNTFSQSSASSQVSIADWLLVSSDVKRSGPELMEKDESDGWSVCSSVHSTTEDQHARDVAVATDYYNKWLL